MKYLKIVLAVSVLLVILLPLSRLFPSSSASQKVKKTAFNMNDEGRQREEDEMKEAGIYNIFDDRPQEGLTKEQIELLCGVNCLYILNRYHGIDISYQDLIHLLNPTNHGTSMLKMKEVAEGIGYCVKAVELKANQIIKYEEPFIGLLLPEDTRKTGHYVVFVPEPEKKGFWIIDGASKEPKKWVSELEIEKGKDKTVNVLLLEPALDN